MSSEKVIQVLSLMGHVFKVAPELESLTRECLEQLKSDMCLSNNAGSSKDLLMDTLMTLLKLSTQVAWMTVGMSQPWKGGEEKLCEAC